MRNPSGPSIALAILAFGGTAVQASITATSSDGYSGNIGLVASKLKVTVGAQWLDVEEEATLSASANTTGRGTGPWLASGTFTVPSGTVVTGCLLWNDDTLLMGKLRGKSSAEKTFDSLVPTLPSNYAYDPLLVEQTNDTTYNLKLYPIGDGGTRRVRIRYLVPVTSTSGDVPILPLFYRMHTGTTVSSWTLDLRGNASGIKLHHDSAWFPVSPPTQRVLGFSTCGAVKLRWTTASSDGTRAVRGTIDSGTWAGDYVFFSGKLPDSVSRKVGIRSETVFLWRWVSPQSFFDTYDGSRSINSYGLQAINQASKIVDLTGQLASMGNSVGLVADQGLNDTTIVFPLSDSSGSSYRRMKTWLNGIDADYLAWRIPASTSTSGTTSDLAIATNRQRFRTDIRAAGALYSSDSGIVRHLVVVTVGPVPSGGDLQEEPDLSPLPDSVSVSSSQLLTSAGWVYASGTGYVYKTTQPSLSEWPGIDLDGVVAARPGKGHLDSIEGVPLPKFRTKISATITLTSSQGNIQKDVLIQRATDGSWTAGINAQAKGVGQNVKWSFYDDSGNVVTSWTETPAWTVANGDSVLPRLWAASSGRISPNFSSASSLAPVFGIVDLQYSLLATPSDSMGSSLQVAYSDSGVPFLSARSIFATTGYGSEEVSISAHAANAKTLSVALLSSRRVRIDFSGLDPRSIEVRDVRGHKVMEWSGSALSGKTSITWNGLTAAGRTVPGGLYVVVVRTSARTLTASVALP